MRIGMKLCSEERTALELVDDACAAEDAGFDFVAISDHFHPWVDAQGQSPFVWAVLGAIAASTDQITVGTAVTCPTVRLHPAIVAHAAATAATLLPDRFFLGLGTGENLNEHILGDPWPDPTRRRWMLQEAIDVIRELWTGQLTSHDGEFYRVQGARLYTLPDVPPPMYVAASGPRSATLAARTGDGLIATGPDADLVDAFTEAGGVGPRLAEMTVLIHDDPDEALSLARERWPVAAIPGALPAELPLPAHFEAAASLLREDDIARSVVVGPDPTPSLERLAQYAEAGFDHVFVHQIGTDQARFLRFARDELLPRAREAFGSDAAA